MKSFQVVALFTDNITDEIFLNINHPDETSWVVIRRHVDWAANETPGSVAASYIKTCWNVGTFHGERSVYASNTEGANVEVWELDFDTPSPVVMEKPTTRTYAVPDDAGSLMLAFSIIDKTGGKFNTLTTCDCQNAQQPGEWHLTVTGLAKLHSDILGEFEWLGK